MIALQKRSTAATIALIVILAATFMGMVRSANAAAAKIEKQFATGVYLKHDKYVEPGIQQQLDKRTEAALGLLTVANNEDYLKADAVLLREAREAILEADTIAEKYAANEKLETAWQQLYESLTVRADKVPASVESYAATLRGAQGAIEKSHYNESAEQFAEEMGAFPIGLIRMLGLVNLPDMFR
jgi:cell division protein FtsX